jgi:hypothetical protein
MLYTYVYRTSRCTHGYCATVTKYGERPEPFVVSRSNYPTRSRAYKAARAMAQVLAKRSRVWAVAVSERGFHPRG